ncbi:NYN domain-containing protein [Colwellia sp. M166]|uniref:NYN domain-containing protein n=1 Tax=Colwellia sp. M166 TaxID=2583805 RepID=UPI00211E464E|nr:NYN domain-containing protein [Colwellia sp. M166]UUO23568.1 NYN domain-containing protein [Colwellia sp. M166]|tara:strand:- start:1880 stop:2371 length:492 start_codon:yes stop_codon:yes gene_type:complete
MQASEQRPKIAIFVDIQNIYYTTRDTFQQQFNYRNFWQQISQQGDIVLANAYAIQRSDDQQHKFQKALKHIGFNVKLKPFIQRRDGSAKGDWDVGIAVDVMETAPEVDIVILLSGDGDFDLLLRKVRSRDGVKTHVYGVTALTAQALINAADEFFPIEQHLLL